MQQQEISTELKDPSDADLAIVAAKPIAAVVESDHLSSLLSPSDLTNTPPFFYRTGSTLLLKVRNLASDDSLRPVRVSEKWVS